MLLRNFAYACCGKQQKDENGVGRLSEYLLAYSGNIYQKYDTSYNGICFLIGTGDTAPTTADLKLAEDVTTQMEFVGGTAQNNSGGASDTLMVVTATYKNTTGSPITIKEVGIGKSYRPYYGANVCIVYTRAVLETPVTMGVGESFTFTYDISIA